MFKTIFSIAIGLTLVLVGMTPGQADTPKKAGNEQQFLQYQPDLTIKFDGSDPQATSVARKMYGHQFRYVEAKRLWLKEPDAGFEQMVLKLSTEKSCTDDCLYAVLFHDDKQWLELWRGKAKNLQFGPVGDNGLRGIYDGTRMWKWTGDEYWPQLAETKFDFRPIKPVEKAAVDKDLARKSDDRRSDTKYSVLDLPLNDGNGAIISISSLYYCGQTLCTVFVLDERAKILAKYGSMEGQAGASSLRDANNNPLVETVSFNGLNLYKIGSDTPAYEIAAQKPTIAGKKRK
ncbi:hypothetical protein [Ochrobactrum sp. BTU1]|uniref:hypothetical protein n=1 Tax=Ochrobactrum sp. BTU1 TaxID=2840456 RepID=UPI001C043338|nr:hypothetical protein KMS41_25840 [Ochrobactrum sp. BTU1]